MNPPDPPAPPSDTPGDALDRLTAAPEGGAGPERLSAAPEDGTGTERLRAALEGGGRAAIVAALERIAAACPGTLAVAVRPAALAPAGVPLGPAPAAPDAARRAAPPDRGDTPERDGPDDARTEPDGHVGLALNEDVELPLASVGKLLLLAEVAMSLDGGILDPDEPVPVHDDDYCGGSGLLLGLSARTWTVGDLALLTAAVSDNTATNALLRRIGLDRVNAAGAALGLTRTRLLDRIREPRGPEHPATFAIGTAGELAGLVALVAGPAGWQVLMREWMLANTDHGLVPALTWHDPEGTRIANKTGTDDGIRTDVGLLGPLAYAVLASGPPGSDQHLVRAVRHTGALIAATTPL